MLNEKIDSMLKNQPSGKWPMDYYTLVINELNQLGFENIEKINPHQNRKEFIEEAVKQLEYTGIVYFCKFTNSFGKIAELYILPTKDMIYYNPYGDEKYYVYSYADMNRIQIEVKDIHKIQSNEYENTVKQDNKKREDFAFAYTMYKKQQTIFNISEHKTKETTNKEQECSEVGVSHYLEKHPDRKYLTYHNMQVPIVKWEINKNYNVAHVITDIEYSPEEYKKIKEMAKELLEKHKESIEKGNVKILHQTESYVKEEGYGRDADVCPSGHHKLDGDCMYDYCRCTCERCKEQCEKYGR